MDGKEGKPTVAEDMTVHFFTKSHISTGSSRQRAFLVAEELEKKGFNTIIHKPPVALYSQVPWPRKAILIVRLVKSLFSIRGDDIVFLQRAIYNKYFFAVIVLWKKLFKHKLIFDFDDAIYLNSSADFFKTKVFCQIADAVIVGSHSLKDWASKYSNNVYLIPTSISAELYEKYSSYKRKPNKEIVIGWIGSGPAHYENLKILVPVFKELINQGIQFKFCLIGALGDKRIYDMFANVEGLDVEIIDKLDWKNYELIPMNIQKFDVGVMPLINTEWHRGRCAFKGVEYMGCGVPAIASPVGEARFLIKDGENGFLAKTTKEWVKKLKTLIFNKDLRERIGKAGQRTIRERYSYEANIPKLIKIIKNLI